MSSDIINSVLPFDIISLTDIQPEEDISFNRVCLEDVPLDRKMLYPLSSSMHWAEEETITCSSTRDTEIFDDSVICDSDQVPFSIIADSIDLNFTTHSSVEMITSTPRWSKNNESLSSSDGDYPLPFTPLSFTDELPVAANTEFIPNIVTSKVTGPVNIQNKSSNNSMTSTFSYSDLAIMSINDPILT